MSKVLSIRDRRLSEIFLLLKDRGIPTLSVTEFNHGRSLLILTDCYHISDITIKKLINLHYFNGINSSSDQPRLELEFSLED